MTQYQVENTTPLLGSNLSKSSTYDLLRNLENKIVNHWHIDVNFSCDECGATYEVPYHTPVQYASDELKEIHEILEELLKRENV